MEDQLWKHIAVTTTTTTATTTILQDFLATPPSHDGGVAPQIVVQDPRDQDHNDDDDDNNNNENGEIFSSGPRELLVNSVISTPGFMSSLNSPFEASAVASASISSPSSSSLLFGTLQSKNERASEDQTRTDGSRADRRYKRMMKNRESAARSRARQQAYTSELEREVAQLIEENAKIREEQQKLLICAPSEIVPKKATHVRSLTAPF